MTIVATGSDEVVERITKHLDRLIEVVEVVDLVERLRRARAILVEVRAVGEDQPRSTAWAGFRRAGSSTSPRKLTLELTRATGELNTLVERSTRA